MNSRCKNVQLNLNSTVCSLHNEYTYHIYVYICTKYGVTMPNHTFPMLCHGGQLYRTMVAVGGSYELWARSEADFDGCAVFKPRSAKGETKVGGYALEKILAMTGGIMWCHFHFVWQVSEGSIPKCKIIRF